jgi:hypothetical protein
MSIEPYRQEKILHRELSIFAATLENEDSSPALDENDDPEARRLVFARRDRDLENQSKIGTIDKKVKIVFMFIGCF